MANQLESLNAGVAASVTLYAIAQARAERERIRRVPTGSSSRRCASSSGGRRGSRSSSREQPTIVVASHDATVHPDLRRVRRGAHRAAAARRPPTRGRAGRRRPACSARPRRVGRRAVRALRLHRQPARVAGRQGEADAVRDIAVSAALRGLGTRPGAARRRGCSSARTDAASSSAGCAPARAPWPGCSCVALPLALWQPWDARRGHPGGRAGLDPARAPSSAAAVPLPDEADGIEVRTGPTTTQTRRLIAERRRAPTRRARTFYAEAAEAAADLELRQPEEDETVALVVSDRHDNIGMDPVARAIGDAGGATVVLDAGDDTSTGQPWEAFSLDSLDRCVRRPRPLRRRRQPRQRAVRHRLPRRPRLDDARRRGRRGPRRRAGPRRGRPPLQRARRLARRDRPELQRGRRAARRRGLRLRGADRDPARARRQPRSRGPGPRLRRPRGRWPHPRPARAGGGPRRGRRRSGWTYTNGTTGGAAYAIAVGSKPRRDADVSLVTYGEDGRPVGMQAGPAADRRDLRRRRLRARSSTPSPRPAEESPARRTSCRRGDVGGPW